MKKHNRPIIGIIGLGYVGLPLALEFGKKLMTVGYDKNQDRIQQLKKACDHNNEYSKRDILNSKKLKFSSNVDSLQHCNFFIIAVPTPVTKNKLPDLKMIKSATRAVAKFIKKNDIIVYESTVFPGVTEEICIPIIEKFSGLKRDKDFSFGYSPERINPGDKDRSLTNITKLISGSSNKAALLIDKVYRYILRDNTYVVKSIKVAEAAKVIENIQRDVNIALINEFSNIFQKLNIDTIEVLEAAKTKWNFHFYEPGLVGGHCIGVDPYYLAFKSKKVGYKPKIILAGRKINENVPYRAVNEISQICKNKNIQLLNSKALILGLTFKENCSDLRNSKVFDLIKILSNKKVKIDIYEPNIDNLDFDIKNTKLIKKISKNCYDIIILAVKHEQFKKFKNKQILGFAKKRSVIFDIKGFLDKSIIDARL